MLLSLQEVGGISSGLPPSVSVQRVIVRYAVCKTMPEKDFKFFTGLSQCNFDVLYELIGGDYVVDRLKYEYNDKTPEEMMPFKKLTARDRLFMMLVRMRRGVPLRDLGYLFGISEPQCCTICKTMIRTTYECLSSFKKAMFVSAEKQKKGMTAPFRPFKNLRVIIDAAEFKIERPSDFQQQGNTYSEYKHYNTEKYLIGTSTKGSIIFCSDGFEGHISDNELVKKSGFLDYLTEGDAVMVDRGFHLAAEFAEKGVRLIRPPDFKKKRKCFTAGEEIFTRQTASARIYVGHAIKNIKDWRLIRYVVPMSMHDVLPQLVFTAAFLTNFDVPFIKVKKTSSRR
ncbi:uncharacterized protein LOC127751004 [Frankliniella occidentalis]|uniref:Uncharacterized protein LOC127751004 n=1 Tax=Frankliniella occidentalis TaxID=133901 RepID=A0A9C6X632_FRAOC|nr:uncharacterized protein LOC127751004 [Frankliniella occidentalis]